MKAATRDDKGCGRGQRCGYVASEAAIEEEGSDDKQGKQKVKKAEGEGSSYGYGVSVRRVQRWLRMRAREAAAEAALEDKREMVAGVGEEGVAAMATTTGGGEEKGDGRGCGQEGCHI
ncbi:hypothetical protein B296_00047068 [Ensete ventricosum]|uniref:Uncharacterized protein n=1 Tax=Ensete ventricosum TaxID=4639 RepID=A0A426WZW1_ENSVE|nr:hypothetical protein B296_00047068 [Ensete ventricosum]